MTLQTPYRPAAAAAEDKPEPAGSAGLRALAQRHLSKLVDLERLPLRRVLPAGGAQPVTVALNNLVNTTTGVKQYNVDVEVLKGIDLSLEDYKLSRQAPYQLAAIDYGFVKIMPPDGIFMLTSQLLPKPC